LPKGALLRPSLDLCFAKVCGASCNFAG